MNWGDPGDLGVGCGAVQRGESTDNDRWFLVAAAVEEAAADVEKTFGITADERETTAVVTHENKSGGVEQTPFAAAVGAAAER